ncbi:SGNH/GDSL hydrolase family protein [Streptomyces sp. UH6]|uniref:SGNH/GDSL hydrolase family protein n=1 Tax=Streptomyces sp. UH6 TaxID=2748379 RepID=UPI0015D50609|nr:SGNH/GDSL hydrolase family protein [Streptomyces sp. UH6]NYV72994.1 SGNH/GDSL hydrolase family protein [Streptomyces sp. UH6]
MRYLFGGIADYVIAPGEANVATLTAGVTVTAWDAATGGTQHTDLLGADGVSPILGGALTTDDDGAIPEFFGPDGVSSLYLDANGGSGPRRRTLTTDLTGALSDASSDAIAKSTATTRGDLLVADASASVVRLGVGGLGETLVADPASAAGVRWGSWWRRRDMPDQALADSLYSGAAPTITTTQTTTPTSGYIRYSPAPIALTGTDVRGPYTWAGAGNFAAGTVAPDTNYVLPLSRYPNTYASGQSHWSVEFGTDAQVMQVRFKYISTASMYRLSVDGRKVTDLMQSSGGTTAGSGHMLTIDLGSAAPRRIRLDFTTMPFGGVYLPPSASMWQVMHRGGRFMALCDSIGDGSNQNTGAGQGTWVHRTGRLLGSTDVWEQGRGGTGYITPGTTATFGTRAPIDVIPWAPDRLVIWGGYNDNSGSQSAIAAAATDLYAVIRAGLPKAQVLVAGCWAPTGSPATSIINTDETLRSAAASAGYPFVSPVTGNIYDATGNLAAEQGPWIRAGQVAAYIGADAVHPTDAGHVYLARRMVAAYAATLPA